MSAQSDARAELTTMLEDIDLVVRDNPKNVNPWCVVIASADPVLVNDNTVGTKDTYDYNVLLQCVGNGPETLVGVENMVENVILALGDSEHWFPGDASAPFWGDGGDGKVYLTVTVQATKLIELNGGS